MFDQEQFVADCLATLNGNAAACDVHEIVSRAVSSPADLIKVLGEPKQGGIQKLYRSPELTIVNVIWRPGMIVMPHNHAMWAVIGVYSGREDNILWRRLPGEVGGKLEAAGAKSLSTKDAVAFGPDVIHSVVNPTSRPTGALHIYGGDFFGAHRSEWDPESHLEQPYDMEKVLRMFAD